MDEWDDDWDDFVLAAVAAERSASGYSSLSGSSDPDVSVRLEESARCHRAYINALASGRDDGIQADAVDELGRDLDSGWTDPEPEFAGLSSGSSSGSLSSLPEVPVDPVEPVSAEYAAYLSLNIEFFAHRPDFDDVRCSVWTPFWVQQYYAESLPSEITYDPLETTASLTDCESWDLSSAGGDLESFVSCVSSVRPIRRLDRLPVRWHGTSFVRRPTILPVRARRTSAGAGACLPITWFSLLRFSFDFHVAFVPFLRE